MFPERPLGEEVTLFQLLVFSVGFFSWYLTAHWANAVTYADNLQPALNLYAFVSFFLIIFGAAGLTRRSNPLVGIFDRAAGTISCAGLLTLVFSAATPFPLTPFSMGVP